MQAPDGDTNPGSPSFHQHAIRLSDIEPTEVHRFKTGTGELDRVLGGGLVAGSVVLVGGEPGIGKSTLLMQVAMHAAEERRVLYATSEESAYQCRLRAERLLGGNVLPSDLFVVAESDIASISEQVQQVRPGILILDSIQMVHPSDGGSSPGGVSNVRRCCRALVHLARELTVAVFIVGHVTKDGQLAGPRTLEHMVDVVLQFEGDRHHAVRALRGAKNRFGTTMEVGLFEMSETGLREVVDAGSLLDPDAPPRSGAVTCAAMHGSRCLLTEVQALVAVGNLGQAGRRATGVDGKRLSMLVAVIERHAGIPLGERDIYASVVGGLRLVEPAADLALCLAIIGTARDLALPSKTCVMGEIGLGGEVLPVPHLEQRLHAAARRGYERVLVPAVQADCGGDAVADVAHGGRFFAQSRPQEGVHGPVIGPECLDRARSHINPLKA